MRSKLATTLLAYICLFAPARSGDPETMADARNTPAERLRSMRSAMRSYQVQREGEAPAALSLVEEPAFRVGRQKGNFIDGAIFLWTDSTGRPEVAMETFLLTEPDAPNGKWIHEFTSLSTDPLSVVRGGKTRWSPAERGLEFRKLPGAPAPASSPSARLRQMRAMADQFKADDDFGERGWEALRMLTTPIARYGKAGTTPEDGALFAFVEGTDHEVFLFLEVRKNKDGVGEWQYALAPMGCWAVKVRHNDREVWSLPRRSTGDPTKPLYNYQFWP
jgi:hypothetical protein